jgi:hypothetical protein
LGRKWKTKITGIATEKAPVAVNLGDPQLKPWVTQMQKQLQGQSKKQKQNARVLRCAQNDDQK